MNQVFIIFDRKEKTNISFFKKISNNLEYDINSIKNIMPNDKIFFVFSNELSTIKIQNKINSIISTYKNLDTFFLLPIKLKNYFENTKNCIFFPIRITDLQSIIKQENIKPLNYKTLELKNNILKNQHNNKFIKLSDIEKEIIKLLFFKNSIQKEIIKVSILKYKIDIKSNSVESHLSRIRNKLEKIEVSLKISSNEKGIISIT